MQLSLFEEVPQMTTDDKVNILLSLNNVYFQRMLNGTKKYEYRFAFPKSEVRAYIYVPKDVKAISGYVDLARPIMGTPEEISTIYENCGDGNYMSMLNYIEKNEVAYAMKIERVVAFKRPIRYETLRMRFPDFTAPQSYIILDKRPDLLKYIVETANDGLAF